MGGPPGSDTYMRVNFGALDQMAADLQSGVSQIDTRLGDLNSQATTLMGTWDGDARQAYQQHQARWTEAAEALKETLRGVKGAVEQSRLDFMQTESRNVNLFPGGA